jgi:hypothetical protein
LRDIINRVEKGLIRIVTITLLALVVIQGLMTSDPIRFYLSWGERMEGQTIEIPAVTPIEEKRPEATVESPQATVTISIEKFSSLPKAKLLVNGKEQGKFTQREVRLVLQAGDTLEIDSGAYNFPINFVITDVSANTEFPSAGQTYTANQTIVMVGKIIVK